jgi:hypothetical protein
MRRLLGALVMTLAGAGAVSADPAPTLHLTWQLLDTVPPEVRERAEQEVAAVIRRAGVDVSWAASDEALLVVLLESGPSRTLPRRLLGVASPDGGGGVWIFYAAIWDELGLRPEAAAHGPLSAKDVQRLGRALGRVVAHEVVHSYQTTHQHSREGLMRAHFDARLLTDDEIEWDLRSQAAFGRALGVRGAKAPRRAAGGSGAGW